MGWEWKLGHLPSCPASFLAHYLFHPSGPPKSEHWPHPHTTGSWNQCLFRSFIWLSTDLFRGVNN